MWAVVCVYDELESTWAAPRGGLWVGCTLAVSYEIDRPPRRLLASAWLGPYEPAGTPPSEQIPGSPQTAGMPLGEGRDCQQLRLRRSDEEGVLR